MARWKPVDVAVIRTNKTTDQLMKEVDRMCYIYHTRSFTEGRQPKEVEIKQLRVLKALCTAAIQKLESGE